MDAVNVTDNQAAIVRMSSLAASALLIQMGLEPVMQMVTRDRNRIAIQSDLFGATALGIRNILCLTGDHHTFGNQVESKNVHDLDSIQLIDCVRALTGSGNAPGRRRKDRGPVRSFHRRGQNPFGDPFEFQAIRLGKKVGCGRRLHSDPPHLRYERFKDWMKMVRDRGLAREDPHLSHGIAPLKSVRDDLIDIENDFPRTVSIPDEIVESNCRNQRTQPKERE